MRAAVPSLAAPPVRELDEAGGRYIDFLLPGLLGANLMGGGLWGVGFVTVDMRVRKLLKRFLATPMRRRDFLLSLMLSRLVFTVVEVAILLGFAWLVFGVRVRGDVSALAALIVLGGASFCGVGLLVACRAKTIETVSGLMNAVMLPMYVTRRRLLLVGAVPGRGAAADPALAADGAQRRPAGGDQRGGGVVGAGPADGGAGGVGRGEFRPGVAVVPVALAGRRLVLSIGVVGVRCGAGRGRGAPVIRGRGAGI